MIDYGVSPAADVVEVTLFGPGYGEAIAVHLGNGAWILIDSCLDPDTREPASTSYLKRIGVNLANVKAVVASHWHDDHVRGISTIAEVCPQADFMASATFNQPEARALLAAHNGRSSNDLSRGTKELFNVFAARDTVHPTLQRSIIFDEDVAGRKVTVTALSPVPGSFVRSVEHMAKYLPSEEAAHNHAPEPKQNLESIVIHVDLGNDALLLGADLEDLDNLGWQGIVQDGWCVARRRASAFKVAHHGSVTGHRDEVWKDFLAPDSVACLTPFVRGSVRLPSDDDRIRIRGKTSHRFISSSASKSPQMDSRLVKRLKNICVSLSVADPNFGAVRLRKPIAGGDWEVELFGAAGEL